jgi:hypothetical protein
MACTISLMTLCAFSRRSEAFDNKASLGFFQGRLYLFEHHVCFYVNVFGYVKTKVIPVKGITSVRKAKTVALFHNALEVSTAPRIAA